ncbi:MAG: class I SAM-dependent methyltransferase [Bacteroidota bacterium]|nr:class I SAM-dependent methyltransferase [Bacteroidota bacterium]
MQESDTIENIQKAHFNQMSDVYDINYSEKYTNEYRLHFVNEPLVNGINLHNKSVLEAMCGSGQTTEFLLSKGAKVTGLDISEDLIEIFKTKYPNSDAVCASIFETPFSDQYFDVVVVVAGLHHLHPRVIDAIEECRRVLKPGGYLVFMEPHSGSVPDIFRKIWYKLDKMFETNEAAVPVEDLKKHFMMKFNFLTQNYTGGLAFLFVFNSFIFRIPIRIKKYYAPLLLNLDKLMSPIFNKYLSCITICQWQKRT